MEGGARIEPAPGIQVQDEIMLGDSEKAQRMLEAFRKESF